MTTPTRRFLSINEVAAPLDVNPRTVLRWISDGQLKAYRVGSALIKIDTADLDNVVRPLPTAGA
jgi:excisionase family DNA binding protein